MNRYYMLYKANENSYFIFDRTRRNQWGERWCEHAYLNEQDAKALLVELNQK